MTLLRVLNIIAWASMLAYMLPGAWSAARGGVKVRRGDPMRLACAMTGIVMVGFNLRWLLAPDDQMIWKSLLVVNIALALYILALGRAYGRGPTL